MKVNKMEHPRYWNVIIKGKDFEITFEVRRDEDGFTREVTTKTRVQSVYLELLEITRRQIVFYFQKITLEEDADENYIRFEGYLEADDVRLEGLICELRVPFPSEEMERLNQTQVQGIYGPIGGPNFAQR